MVACLTNYVLILRNEQEWQGVIAYDEFRGSVMKRKPPPFTVASLGEWLDEDDVRLRFWFAERYGMRKLAADEIRDAVFNVADGHRYHEVREYLQGLKWDGAPRIDHWLSMYLGAPDTEHSRLAGRKWLVGAVLRVMRAPIKFDHVLILKGDQGIGKSTTFKILFDPWFTDAAFDLRDTQEAAMVMRGHWGCEFAELDSFNRAEDNAAKAFFSRDRDVFRNPYGRRMQSVPRQQAFGGTVNHDAIFKDVSGNRRYWVIAAQRCDFEALANDRDQLWAEAMHMAEAGTEVHYIRRTEMALFKDAAESSVIGDAWETKIRRYVNDADQRSRPWFTTADLLQHALHIDAGRWTEAEQRRIGRLMQHRLGWVREREPIGDRDWGYLRAGVSKEDFVTWCKEKYQ